MKGSRAQDEKLQPALSFISWSESFKQASEPQIKRNCCSDTSVLRAEQDAL